ncbi:MAG: DNA polymerase/3'-5' exonuclease PolX [Chloroflexi bacterium]|nr:DNA polymerase/3'-5' exonuclease PolX [Chloroflexota bacterium]
MNNKEISKIFEDIAELLELKGESSFKVRAYQRAAHTIDSLTVEAASLWSQGRLKDIPGVGESLAQKIEELLSTGRSGYYETLKAEFPEGIVSLMDIPGVGPKTAARLVKELGVTSVEELEQAVLAGRVAALYRMGEKTAERILRQIQVVRRKNTRIPLGEALPVVEEIISALRHLPGLRNLTAAGSLRRFAETVGDIDLMGTAADAEAVIQAFVHLPQVREMLVAGDTKGSVVIHSGLQVDLRIVEHEAFGSLLQYFTGGKDHNIALRDRAHRQGLKLSEYGITDIKTGILEKFDTEEAFYRRLGLPWIPPELRENRGEIESAEKGELPDLLELRDIKGDLHDHTNWSDGHTPPEGMVEAAVARGYQYLIISDHSAGRGVARGLTVERLHHQAELIREMNRRYPITVLAGSEVDIRADGSLDFPDEILAELDVVVASVHSAMGQEAPRMTERILKAIRNPHVDIIAHLTCRLLGEREPIEVDLEAIFRAAAETGTALEINAMPSRLDLKDVHIMRARELGVPLVISTDAHGPEQLDVMRFGVGTARRGWCRPEDILNTRPWPEVAAFLRKRVKVAKAGTVSPTF